MFTALFAFGLVLLSLHGDEEIHVEDILLGQITTISNTDVLVTVFLALVTFTIMVLLHKQLVFVGFDYEGAVVAGLPASRIDYLLLALLSVVIVVSLQIVGIILVVGMLITPAAAASLIAKRFSSAIVLGIVFGVTSGVVGLYMSYYFNLPSGPAIALTSTAIFTLSFLNRLRTT
jgi:manganese/iron transport system permease protein